MGQSASRVLIVIEDLPYPTDRRVLLEVEALREAGFQVAVICPAGRARWTAHHEVVDGVLVYRFSLPEAGSGILSYIREYVAALTAIYLRTVRLLLRDGFDVL